MSDRVSINRPAFISILIAFVGLVVGVVMLAAQFPRVDTTEPTPTVTAMPERLTQAEMVAQLKDDGYSVFTPSESRQVVETIEAAKAELQRLTAVEQKYNALVSSPEGLGVDATNWLLAQAEQESARRAALTPEQRAEEDRLALEQAQVAAEMLRNMTPMVEALVETK